MQSFRSIFVITALAALLGGCSTTIELSKRPNNSPAKVVVNDFRPADERIYRRDGALSPIQYFGDDDFSSNPLNQFATILDGKLPQGTYELNIKKFRIIDIFPQRQGVAIAGALIGTLHSMGYSAYVSGTSSLSQDNVTCIFGGSLQGKSLSAAISVPYRISPLAGLVKKDPAFQSAVNECLTKLAESVSKSS
jgi:hypothetical protein